MIDMIRYQTKYYDTIRYDTIRKCFAVWKNRWLSLTAICRCTIKWANMLHIRPGYAPRIQAERVGGVAVWTQITLRMRVHCV